MKNQNNNWIEIIDNPEKNEYGLGIDVSFENINIGKIQKIKYDYIKWEGLKTIINKDTKETKQIVFIEFNRIISGSILNLIKVEIEGILNIEDISITDALENILRLFQKTHFKKMIREIIYGDIGELLFIIKSKKCIGIDFQECLRSNENALYDFKYKEKFIEVKSATKSKHDFNITFNQLNEFQNKILIISKFKCVENETNILDLFDQLEPLCDLLKEKKNKWEQINNDSEMDIITKYSINLDKSNCFVFKNNKLPIINIEREGAYKEMKILIDATDSNIDSLSKLKEILNLAN